MLSPFRRFWDAQRDLNRIVTDTFWPQMSTTETGWTPAVDVTTEKGDMLIRAELPGMKREDVDVSFQDGVLTISGERKEEEERKGANYLVKERRYGSFRRSMALPEGIDENKIKASFKDGVLEVRVEGAGTQIQQGPKRIEMEG